VCEETQTKARHDPTPKKKAHKQKKKLDKAFKDKIDKICWNNLNVTVILKKL